nr:MAG TPA: hypothetical protein [Caudoviricetes sp.]
MDSELDEISEGLERDFRRYPHPLDTGEENT